MLGTAHFLYDVQDIQRVELGHPSRAIHLMHPQGSLRARPNGIYEQVAIVLSELLFSALQSGPAKTYLRRSSSRARSRATMRPWVRLHVTGTGSWERAGFMSCTVAQDGGKKNPREGKSGGGRGGERSWWEKDVLEFKTESRVSFNSASRTQHRQLRLAKTKKPHPLAAHHESPGGQQEYHIWCWMKRAHNSHKVVRDHTNGMERKRR